MKYSILINVEWVNGHKVPFWGYNQGDRLVKTYEGEQGSCGDPSVALEQIYARHNADDRPDGQLGPSLSVSDVVILGEQAYSVESVGFDPIEMPANVETEKSWPEIVKEREQ